ncbi:Choline dehydrogenase [Sphingobium sp. AP50]|uniref:FAD-dependent oxidoreductase n=1 Tax=Sphingobium sp. AP50 TaxID=1884369 RepID=UPI0008B17AD7|nr:GMC family oxidoreductase [Sphingobium sp. AP50]SEJ95044.1 Choline dehydrogenase [Sphingobium sp. AP50]
MTNGNFDAIVVGSGITGGWAAKELTERGLRVVMIERGPMVEHGVGYETEMLAPWDMPYRGFGNPKEYEQLYRVQSRGAAFDEWSKRHFVNDALYPYEADGPKPFQWRRGYQLGGRSLTWGRHCYRWSDLDFTANALDGNGSDWPIRYADLADWYDHVETFVGVSGSEENLDQLPDGRFQPPMALNAVEKHAKSVIEGRYPDRRLMVGRVANLTEEKEGRSKCQYRGICARGCSYGAYFSTQSATLPAGQATGRLTLITDAAVERVEYDARLSRATGVTIIHGMSRKRETISANMVFVCAGAVNSVSLLLRSVSQRFPRGIGNDHDVLGRYFMDHATAVSAVAMVPGFTNHSYFGNRPNNLIIPRFRNLAGKGNEFLRGYSFQGGASRTAWRRGAREAGIGEELKQDLRKAGDWKIMLRAYAECLPRHANRISLSDATDPQGLARTRIEFSHGANERALLADAESEALEMLALIDAEILSHSAEPDAGGSAVHEMGGARMGRDPRTSILNAANQVHGIANLFVTDGAAMASSACQNPSLTYMALTARAAAFAAKMMKEGGL